MNAELIKKIKARLRDLSSKKNILITKRGNQSIREVIRLAKSIGREKILIQDQGGWIINNLQIKKV